MTMVTLITFPARSMKWHNGSKIYLFPHLYNPIMSWDSSMPIIHNYQNAAKSWTMLIDFLKMFIDTGIPFDKSLVQLLEPNQNIMLVQVWSYSSISRSTMQLTNNGSFCIRSMYIGHFAGVAGIIEHLWNNNTVLVTNLFWVTWNPSVSRWRVSFCLTVESYTLLYTNNILRLKINNCGWICTSNWKRKNQIKNLHLYKDTSEWLAFSR